MKKVLFSAFFGYTFYQQIIYADKTKTSTLMLKQTTIMKKCGQDRIQKHKQSTASIFRLTHTKPIGTEKKRREKAEMAYEIVKINKNEKVSLLN